MRRSRLDQLACGLAITAITIRLQEEMMILLKMFSCSTCASITKEVGKWFTSLVILGIHLIIASPIASAINLCQLDVKCINFGPLLMPLGGRFQYKYLFAHKYLG